MVEYCVQLCIDELHFEGKNLVVCIEVVDIDNLLELVNLSADLHAIFDACKHDTLGDGAEYFVELISLLCQLYSLSHGQLLVVLHVLDDQEVYHEANDPVAK